MPESAKLHGVHPHLVDAFTKIRLALAELGFSIVVTDGVRTLEQQQALYAKGRTAPGSIVTYADGVLTKSNHQVKADGFGYAIDCAFLLDGRPSWSSSHPWRLYGEAAKALGLVWGGDWTRPMDRPHIELPDLP